MSVSASAERRVALVIGNANYEAAPLQNPGADAQAMANLLKNMGFDVTEGLDLDHAEMSRVIGSFLVGLRGADIALFYFAGHGVQLDNENFVIPVDNSLSSEAEIQLSSIKLSTILSAMERSAKTSITLLDACRNNPFEEQLATSLGSTRSAGLQRGLAGVEAGVGSLVAFATAPDQVAFDGAGRHSPFTQALLDHLGTPDRSISSIMTSVTASVFAATDQKQRPYTTMSLLRDVYLGGASTRPEVEQSSEQLASVVPAEESVTRQPAPVDINAQEPSLKEIDAKPSKDRSNPNALELFEVADGRIGKEVSHFWRFNLLPGDYKIVVDAERADDEFTFTSFSVDFLTKDGTNAAEPLAVNGNYIRRRTIREISVLKNDSVDLVIGDAKAVIDYDIVIVPTDQIVPTPYLKQEILVTNLAIGEKAEGRLAGHDSETGELWYRVQLDAADYDIIFDASFANGSSGFVSSSLEVLGAEAEILPNELNCQANGPQVVNTCVLRLSFAEERTIMLRALSNNAASLATGLLVRQQ